MWGEVTRKIDDGITAIRDVGLLRGIARLDVLLAGGVNNFKLDEVYVYSSKIKGHVVPATGNLEMIQVADNPDIIQYKVKAATVPTGEINNNTPLFYPVPAAQSALFEREIYLFEAKAAGQSESSKATCVVVGGTFGSDGRTTYYRLDFFRKDENTQEFTKDYKDILRNHQYRMVIKSVSGRGYDTPDDAFNSKAINMVVDVTEWDDGQAGDVIFDGQHYLSIKPEMVFNFDRDADAGSVKVKTDVPDGWKITKITEADGTTPNSGWLSTDKITDKAYGTGEAEVPVAINVTENSGGVARTGYIFLQAGRLVAKLTVNQGVKPKIGLEITDPVNGQQITELVFTSKAGEMPAAKIFDVKWVPAAASPIVNISKIGEFAFDFNNAPPNDKIESGTLPGGTGEKRYTIQPYGIDIFKLQNNPFMECISKVDYTVSNGENFMSKSIILRQTVYDLIADAENYYLMDGNEHSFKVRINYPWRAELFDDGNGAVTQLLSTAGNPNTTGSGISIRFNTANDMADPQIYTGTPKVRFYHASDNTIYEDVELFCVSGVIQEASNCHMVEPGSMPILIPVSQANADGTTRIGSNDTYTAELIWTDHQGGVKATSQKTVAAIDNIIVAGKGNTGYIFILPGAEEGNSVVAVKVGNVIKWSWHIWTTAYTGNETYTNNDFIFMDRHLGAFTGFTTGVPAGNAYHKTGLLYQWGRKDPTPTGNPGNNEPTLYNASGVGATNRIATVHNAGSLDLSIQNPASYYSSWSSGTWGVTKTAYDPCPRGWKVPSFKNNNSPSVANSPWGGLPYAGWYPGYDWGSKMGFYPATGWRKGGLAAVGLGGNAWIACSYNANNAYYVICNNGGFNPAYADIRAHSLSVRCVKE